MKIAVIDDELVDRTLICKMLTTYISGHHLHASFEEFASAKEFLAAPVFDFQLIFLDIYMPGMNGADLAREIRKTNQNAQIIFITSSNAFAADAFEVSAFSYLRKPLLSEKFNAVMDQVVSLYTRLASIQITCNRMPVSLFTSDILYLESLGRKLNIHTSLQLYETNMSLKSALLLLPANEFVQISRYEAVSLRHIRLIALPEIFMDDGTTLLSSSRLSCTLSEKYEIYRRLH